jgi:ATP-dependent RNA helicase RhlE
MSDNSRSFVSLGLVPPLLRALGDLDYLIPTPIQEQAIPPLLQGRDVLGCAQTGTGKTAAFALPVLQQLMASPAAPRERLRALVLAPTRELALQIEEAMQGYGKHTAMRSTVIFGGVGQAPQVAALRRGVDVLVATPGRLLDLHGQGHLDLRYVRFLVLDEADRMLDMGFVRDVRKIVGFLPNRKQTLMFSATMAPEIRSLADELLRDPVAVAVTPAATTVEKIDQSIFHVAKADKRALLEKLLLDPAVLRCVVFTRTKHGADKVAQNLERAGISSAAIHGNRSQNQRVRALDGFKAGEITVLVATDIAARGLDIDGVSHVINYELPNEPDSYVHRIGRTARNGAAGVAWAMCDPEELPLWRDIEKRIRQSVPWAQSGELTLPAPPAPGERRADSNGNRPGQNQRNTPPASRARDQRLRQPHQASPASQGERQPRSPERQPRGPQGSAPAANPGHQVPRRAPRDQAPSPYGGLPRAAVSQPEAPRTSEFGARVERDWY